MLRSSLLVSALSLLTSLASFVNQVLIARAFGATVHLDLYLAATSVPSLLMGMSSGLIAHAVVPNQMRNLHDRHRFVDLSTLMFLVFLACAVVAASALLLLSPLVIQALMPDLSEPLAGQAILVARLSALSLACTITANYLASLHSVAKRFVVPVLANAFPYLAMSVATLLMAQALGVAALAWGMLAGYLVQLLVLFTGAAKNMRIHVRCLSLWREALRVCATIPLVFMSMLCFTVYGVADAFWATRLGPNNLSYLGYNQRLLIAIGSILSLGAATVLLPYLSEAAAQGEDKRFRQLTRQALRMMLALAAPAAVAASVLRVEIVQVLFERGAFDRTTTLAVAAVLPWMMAGMVAMLSVVLLFKGLYARGAYRAAAVLGSAGAAVYALVAGILSGVLGLEGMAIAYASTWWGLLGATAWLLWRRGSEPIIRRDDFRFLAQLCGVVLASGVSTWVCREVIVAPMADNGAAALVAGVAFTGGVAAVCSLFLGLGVFRMREFVALSTLMPLGNLRPALGRDTARTSTQIPLSH